MGKFAVIVVALMLAAVALGCGSSPTPTATVTVTAGGAVQDDTGGESLTGDESATPEATATAQASDWVKVFTWKGGAEGNFIKNSKKFELKGGDQKVVTSVQKASGWDDAPVASWDLMQDEYSIDSIMTEKKNDTSLLYVAEAGTYYLSANTLGCYWTVTVYEKR